MALQSRPLQLEQVLLEHERTQLCAVCGATLAQHCGIAVAVRRRPLPPRRSVEALAQELEKAIGHEPAAVDAHERGEPTLLRDGGLRRERRVAGRAVALRIDTRRQLGRVGEIRAVDEPGVAGMSRAQGVRRAVCVSDAERQRLPDAEAAFDEPIDEAASVGAERTARLSARQRRQMEQDAGPARGE